MSKIKLPTKDEIKKYGLILAIEILIVIVLVAIDLLTKEYIYGPLAKAGEDKVLIDGFLNLSPRENTGAAFSVLSGNALILAFVSLVSAIAVIVFQIWSIKWRNPCLRSGLILILAGAIGNMIDRFLLGYVRDFIDLKGIFNWVGVFNFADSCITVGAVVVIVYLIFFYNSDAKKYAPQKATTADESKAEESLLENNPIEESSKVNDNSEEQSSDDTNSDK